MCCRMLPVRILFFWRGTLSKAKIITYNNNRRITLDQKIYISQMISYRCNNHIHYDKGPNHTDIDIYTHSSNSRNFTHLFKPINLKCLNSSWCDSFKSTHFNLLI